MNSVNKAKIQNIVNQIVAWSQKFTDKPWYPLAIGFFAFIDNLVIVIPTDGILVSSILLRPRQWLVLSWSVTLGSSLGALLLAYLVEIHGLPWLLNFLPDLMQGTVWLFTEKFFLQYGLIIVFLVAAAPIFQHPAIVLAALSNISLHEIFWTVFLGRLLKYLIIGFVSSFAPKYLSKLWGLNQELEEVGISDVKKAEDDIPPLVANQ